MTKEDCIQSIRSRILSEFGKHKDLDWAEIAAHKIYSQFIEDKKQAGSCGIYEDARTCLCWVNGGRSCDGCPINGDVQV